MAVNTNFYLTANELMSRAATGVVDTTMVVDYNTFIDRGKALANLSYQDLQNSFVPYVMNKVQRTIQDTPAYMGQLLDLDKGRLDYGVLEILVDDFYEASPSTFDGATLTAGQTYTDQFTVVNLPNSKGKYYTESDSFSFHITIRDTDLKGIFTDPNLMDAFIRKCFINVANSIEDCKEKLRFSLIAMIIKGCAAKTAQATSEDTAGVHYNLLGIYNAEKGTSLTADSCRLNNDFCSWSAGVIRDVRGRMMKPSKLWSIAGDVKTFTPESYSNCVINAVYDKALRRSLIDAYNTQYGMIDFRHEIVPYWQIEGDRLRVTTNETPSGSDPIVTTYSPYVVAVLYDRRAAGILTQLDAATTDRNGARMYTNYHFNLNYMLYQLTSANTAIFTLGSAS